MDGPDWPLIRATLRVLRTVHKHSLSTLATASGIDKATIHRIENVPGYPSHQPDLNTISALVRAYGLTVVDFFQLVEGVGTPGHRRKLRTRRVRR